MKQIKIKRSAIVFHYSKIQLCSASFNYSRNPTLTNSCEENSICNHFIYLLFTFYVLGFQLYNLEIFYFNEKRPAFSDLFSLVIFLLFYFQPFKNLLINLFYLLRYPNNKLFVSIFKSFFICSFSC